MKSSLFYPILPPSLPANLAEAPLLAAGPLVAGGDAGQVALLAQCRAHLGALQGALDRRGQGKGVPIRIQETEKVAPIRIQRFLLHIKLYLKTGRKGRSVTKVLIKCMEGIIRQSDM